MWLYFWASEFCSGARTSVTVCKSKFEVLEYYILFTKYVHIVIYIHIVEVLECHTIYLIYVYKHPLNLREYFSKNVIFDILLLYN